MITKLKNAPVDIHALHQYLQFVDSDFLVPLSSKVNLLSYTTKLLTNGHVYAEWEDKEIVGVVAFYCNDKKRGGTLPLLSVRDCCRGKGIARQLVTRAINHCSDQGMDTLSCDTVNPVAAKVYKSLGFITYCTENKDGVAKEYLRLNIHNQQFEE